MSNQDLFLHSSRHQVFLWSTALTLIALGIYLTHIKFLNTEWVSRSGCLVVMLGIWSGLGVIVQERLLLGRLRWRRRNAMIAAKARIDAQPELEKEIDAIERAFEKQAEELTQRLKLSLGVLEVSLLLTGTFVWGFGDLLFR